MALLSVARAAGFGGVEARLHVIEWRWLAVVGGAELAAYGGYVLAYHGFARAEGDRRVSLPWAATVVAGGFGVFLPRGGFVFDRAALDGIGTSRPAVLVLGLGALEYAVIAPAACVASVILLLRGVRLPPPALTVPWAICVPIGFGLAFAALPLRRRLADDGRLRRALRSGLDAVVMLPRIARRASAAPVYGGMLVYWLGEITALWAAVVMFAPTTPGGEAVIVGYATGYALTRRTLPLGGAGVVEAFLPFALSWVGVSLAVAVLAVFVYRLFNLVLFIPLAAVALRRLQLPSRTAPAGQR